MGDVQRGLSEPVGAHLEPGEVLVAATWADRRDGSANVGGLIAGGLGAKLTRSPVQDAPQYPGLPGYAGSIPFGYLVVAVTDRRLLVLWAATTKSPLVPLVAFGPHDYQKLKVSTAFAATLAITFADNTTVFLDLAGHHKAKAVAKAAFALRAAAPPPGPHPGYHPGTYPGQHLGDHPTQ